MNASLQKLLVAVSRVKEAAESFTNPMFRHYFSRKASEELQMLKEYGKSMPSTEIEKRMAFNEELEGILRRQSAVHNYYYVPGPSVEK